MDKLSIQNEMIEFDRKNRSFYSDLTDDERKKFSNYLMIRWGSSVQGDRALQEYYVQSCNHYLNRHFFSINRHPRLQWLSATAVSPGLGTPRHQWIAPKKKESKSTEIRKQLIELFPNMKTADIDVLAVITDKNDIKEYLLERGVDSKN